MDTKYEFEVRKNNVKGCCSLPDCKFKTSWTHCVWCINKEYWNTGKKQNKTKLTELREQRGCFWFIGNGWRRHFLLSFPLMFCHFYLKTTKERLISPSDHTEVAYYFKDVHLWPWEGLQDGLSLVNIGSLRLIACGPLVGMRALEVDFPGCYKVTRGNYINCCGHLRISLWLILLYGLWVSCVVHKIMRQEPHDFRDRQQNSQGVMWFVICPIAGEGLKCDCDLCVKSVQSPPHRRVRTQGEERCLPQVTRMVSAKLGTWGSCLSLLLLQVKLQPWKLSIVPLFLSSLCGGSLGPGLSHSSLYHSDGGQICWLRCI